MSVEPLSILILGAVFLIATVGHIHMGALAIAAAFVLGMCVLPGDFDAKVDQIAGGFPGDLFVVLAGVTYLFAIARNNGTVDWLVQAALRSVRGRVALVPWVMFLVAAAATAVGAVAPAMVAMLAPVGIAFALRHRRSPVLVGLMIVNGASAGSFSPIGVFGSITNSVVERNGLEGSPPMLFVTCFLFNVLLGVIAVALFGGQTRAVRPGVDAAATDADAAAFGAAAPRRSHAQPVTARSRSWASSCSPPARCCSTSTSASRPSCSRSCCPPSIRRARKARSIRSRGRRSCSCAASSHT